MRIKVCGMKYPQNIEALGILPVHFMGLIFYPKSPRYAGDLDSDELALLLPDHIRKVGVFVDADKDDILEKAERYQLHYIQFHGNESVGLIREVKSGMKQKIKTIKAFNVSSAEDFEKAKSYTSEVDYFLFDTKTDKHGGSGNKFDWSILDAYKGKTPFFLSGGISPEDVEAIKTIRHPKLFAIDINSRFEMEPGLKDINKIEKFTQEIIKL